MSRSSRSCFRNTQRASILKGMLEDPSLPALADRIRRAIQASRRPKADIAEKLGVSPQAVTGWEKKGRISKTSLSGLARLLSIPLDDILTGGERFERAIGAMQMFAVPPVIFDATDAPTPAQNFEAVTAFSASHAHQSAGETPSGYVRVGLLDAVGEMGAGAENADFPEVIREMDLAEVQVRNLLGFLPRPGRLKLMTGRGISMDPVIKSGDVVVVDTGCKHFDGDGIYVINTGSGVQIKALQDRSDGMYVVSANPTFPAYRASDELLIGGKVYVRNRLERLD